MAGDVVGGNKCLLDSKMTEYAEESQGSATFSNQHTHNSLSQQSAGSPCYGNQDTPPTQPGSGCLQPLRSCSLKWELSVLAFLLFRKWK